MSCSQDAGWSCSHLKTGLRLVELPPRGLTPIPGKLVSVARGLRSSPHRLLHRASWVSSWHDSWRHLKQVVPDGKVEAIMSFIIQPWDSHCIISATLYWWYRLLSQYRRELHRRCEYQEVRMTGSILTAGCSTSLVSSSASFFNDYRDQDHQESF